MHGERDAVLDSYSRGPSDDALVRDSVFAAFCSGLLQFKGRGLTVLDAVREPVFHKRFVEFEHLSIPYCATVVRYQHAQHDGVEIRLPANGTKLTGSIFQNRHNGDGWVAMHHPDVQQFFPTLVRNTKEGYSAACFYYHSTTSQLDIKLMPKEGTDMPILEIAFEPGHHRYIDNPADLVAWQ